MEHFYKDDIFDESSFNFKDLYLHIIKNSKNNSKFVEVGSREGRSSCYMSVEIANSNKDIDFYCIDSWDKLSQPISYQIESDPYNKFLSNMKPVEDYYIPLKLNSIDASKKFKNNSLDFVFIYPSRNYEEVKNEITHWLPKIKSGGVLAAHNYSSSEFPHIKMAADEILGEANLIKVDKCFVYYKDKLNNFPTINVISLKESHDRRSSLEKNFLEKSIDLDKVNFHLFDRFKEEDHKITGTQYETLSFDSKGPLTSHFKAIKNWIKSSSNDEDYTFFCEDDFTFSNIKYWNFNWEFFFNRIPKNWSIVQLVIVREPGYFWVFGDKFRNRCWCDWSCAGYLIKKDFAKRLIKNYYPEDVFTLEYCGTDKHTRYLELGSSFSPNVETLIFSYLQNEHLYAFNLFSENIKECPTTAIFVDKKNADFNVYSYHECEKFWKNIQHTHQLDYIFSEIERQNNG